MFLPSLALAQLRLFLRRLAQSVTLIRSFACNFCCRWNATSALTIMRLFYSLLMQQSAVSATGAGYWAVGGRPVAAERAHVEAEAALERRHWPLHARSLCSSRRFHLSAQAAKLARSSAKSVRLGIYQARAPLRIYIESQLGALHNPKICVM
jgi:hypothetical protein